MAVEDDRLLDHHIEEVLGRLRDVARMREDAPEAREQRDD
jgi:hypothetical protein